ncbi:MAG: DUF2330 domain-containing protein [Elusimicrobia bacterium]|nr:DUF2330 domain-containing protein [Elusimicrobiota bacterium]
MGRTLARTALLGLLAGGASVCLPETARADGIMWDAPNARELVLETAQKAWVEWEGGREKLTIAARPEGASPHLAWFVPIPVPTRQARLALVDSLPDWPGTELRVAAHLASHPVMLCFFFFVLLLLNASLTEGAIVIFIIAVLSAISIGPGPSVPHYADTQVQALSHLELGGLASELVDAPSIDAFERYLKSKSCVLPAAARSGVEEHIRAGSAFVVSWAKGPQVSKSLALAVEFPAPKPWYPVRLTSAYGDNRLAIDLYLSGWLAPDSSTLPPSALVGYYLGAGVDGRRFTRILYQGRASVLKEDWLFGPRPRSTDLQLAAWVAAHPLIANILLLLLAAMVGGMPVGWLLFPDWRGAAGLRPLLLLSASGVLPFLGPRLALRRLRPQERPPEPVPEVKTVAPAPPVPWRHWAIPVVLVGVACQVAGIVTEGAAGVIGLLLGFVLCSAGLSAFHILRGYGKKVSIISSCALSALVPVVGPILGMFSSPEPTKAPAKALPAALPVRWQAFIFGAAAASLFLNLFAGSWLLGLWPLQGATASIEHSSHGFSNLIRKSNEGATRGNLGQIRGALSIYYGDKDGLYPAELDALTKTGKSGLPYLEKIHAAKTPPHHPDSSQVRYGKDIDDSGGWLYNNLKGDGDFGELRVNCTHTDTKGSAWDSY